MWLPRPTLAVWGLVVLGPWAASAYKGLLMVRHLSPPSKVAGRRIMEWLHSELAL